MSGLGTVIRAGVRRRRMQTVVIVTTITMAVTASVLGAGLIVASRAPFDRAFARANGAHLSAEFDPARASQAAVAATAHVSGVTAAGGPYPMVSLRPVPVDTDGGLPPDIQLGDLTIVARPGTDQPVDTLTLTKGRWATGPGEIVMSAHNEPFVLGNTLRFPGLPHAPVFRVVGVVRSASETSDAWVSPDQIASLTESGTQPHLQILYRFRQAATDADVAADRSAIAAAVPRDALIGVGSYLKIKQAATRSLATFAPFVVAFGVLGLTMSVLVIGIVVSGAVTAGIRRIGILKSLGFTPGQVIRAYLAQALLPGALGVALGILAGHLAAVPVMGDAGEAFGIEGVGIPLWVDVAVAAATLLVIIASALAPALRAGRLRSVEAISVGRTPSAGRGRIARRVLGRLPLPRPVSLGLSIPFSRPSRSATMALAVVVGTLGATFAVGLVLSLSAIQQGINLRSPGDVVVNDLTSPPTDPGKIRAAIEAQPGTGRWFESAETSLGVAGLGGSTTVVSYLGDSSWAPWQLIRGSWLHAPGEVDVPSGFLRATGSRIGDTVTLLNGSRSVPVRIVGEVLDVRQEGMLIVTDRATIAPLRAQLDPLSVRFNIQLSPDSVRDEYLARLNEALQPLGVSAAANAGELSQTVLAMDAVAVTLTLILLAVGGLGVLTTVVLDTRERVHDFGVFKALGMTPRQTITMILTSVAGLGLVAGVLGVPLGMLLHGAVLPVMGRAAGTDIPPADTAVYHSSVLAPLLLGGLVLATVGALLPAGWATRTRTAAALRTE